MSLLSSYDSHRRTVPRPDPTDVGTASGRADRKRRRKIADRLKYTFDGKKYVHVTKYNVTTSSSRCSLVEREKSRILLLLPAFGITGFTPRSRDNGIEYNVNTGRFEKHLACRRRSSREQRVTETRWRRRHTSVALPRYLWETPPSAPDFLLANWTRENYRGRRRLPR